MHADLDSRLKTLTIILGAMFIGIATLAVVFLVLKPPGPLLPSDSGQQLLLAILAGMGLMESPVFFAVRAMKLAQVRERMAAGGAEAAGVDLPQEYFTLTLIPAALAEGFGLFGAIVYLLSASPLALLAPVIGCMLIVALRPTRWKYDNFVESVSRKAVR